MSFDLMVPPCHAWGVLIYIRRFSRFTFLDYLDKDKAIRVSFARLGLEIKVWYWIY